MSSSRATVVSSFTIIKGSMIEETYAVLRDWDFGRSREENLREMRDGNTIGASSASWLRDVYKVLHRRFDPNKADRPLALLAQAGISMEVWKPILLWHMTRDEFLLRDFLTNWLFQEYEKGAFRLQEAIDQMRAIRNGTEDDAITTFNAAHKGIKEAIKRGAELKLALTEPALMDFGRACQALEDAWSFLEQESDLPDGLAGRAATLADLMKKKTFFRELSAIEQAATAIQSEYDARFEGAVKARAEAYQSALDKLHAMDAWGELNEEQQSRIAQPLGARTNEAVIASTSIPFLRSELSACPQHMKAAVKQMMELIEGNQLVTLSLGDFFESRIETPTQLEAALNAIKQRVEKLLGEGKKVLVQ